MRPEIFHTFENNLKPQADEEPRITVGEIKESLKFFAGLAMEVLIASREVAEKDGLRALGKELKSIKSWRPNMFKL